MSVKPQLKIPASYMRGGTSKGIFFRLQDLPQTAQVAGEARDKLMQRVIGSPDPYAKQTDGMGGATSSTSKVVIIAKSSKVDHDVDYLFGQIAIDKDFVDWSGNCGNLSAAVGPFAISNGFIDKDKIPQNGLLSIKIWQVNIQKTIIAHVPIINSQVQELGDFELDGVTFPAAEIPIEFIDPADDSGDDNRGLFPTGNVSDTLVVPNELVEGGKLQVTLINAGIPTIFIDAQSLGYRGTELQHEINADLPALERFEALRAIGAMKMGLINDVSEAASRQHTPKIAIVALPQDYVTSSGKAIKTKDSDLLVRAMSMGKLHHAMMGTAAVAIGTAAAIPGTLVNLAAGGGELKSVCFGHPSGTLTVGTEAKCIDEQWHVTKAIMSRSARVLMEGWVRVPESE